MYVGVRHVSLFYSVQDCATEKTEVSNVSFTAFYICAIRVLLQQKNNWVSYSEVRSVAHSRNKLLR